MRFSGDQTLVGVFQGTTGLDGSGPADVVDAKRHATTRRRHCACDLGRARSRADIIRGGGIVGM
jgi:hypothetical protein